MTYCFTGYPLAGKTRMAKAIAARIGVKRFSTGDFARSIGMGMEESIAERDMSVKYDERIVEAAVEAVGRNDVIDGFPRSVLQVDALRAAGIEFKVIFVIENPLVIFDRIKERAAAQGRPEDRPDVVAGRLRASIAFKRELEGVLNIGEMLTFQSCEGADALALELGL